MSQMGRDRWAALSGQRGFDARLEACLVRGEANKMFGEEFLVGPLEADTLLSYSNGNRKESQGGKAQYAHDMENDLWRRAGDGPRFTFTRVLFNGHHTLKSIRTSGKTLPILITFGCDEDAFKTADCGIVRPTHVRANLGANDVSWLRMALRLESGKPRGSSRTTVDDVLAAHERYANAISDLKALGVRRFPASFWGAMTWAYPTSWERVVEFARVTGSGLGLTAGEPSRCLHEYLRDADSAGASNQFEIAQRSLYALRAHLEGRRLPRFSPVDQSDSVFLWFARQGASGERYVEAAREQARAARAQQDGK